jgi:CcmD family protein
LRQAVICERVPQVLFVKDYEYAERLVSYALTGENSMTVLAAAFACVWIALALYVGWLGRNQRRLAARLRELAALQAEIRDKTPTTAKAA